MTMWVVGLAVAAIASASVAGAVPAVVTAPVTQPARLPLTVQFDVASKLTGRTYRIYVAKPFGPAPKAGWPVITVLDADVTFATVAAQNLLRMSTGQSAAVIVGVAYPDALAAIKLRSRDLTPTPPLPDSEDAKAGKPEGFGGATLFHRFLIEELRPQVAALAPVDAGNQTLIGYSLGGLFALGVLFDSPQAYRTIVAGSPSIWWNNRELLKKEAGFAAAVRAGTVTTRVLITSAQWEQSNDAPDLPGDPAKRTAAISAMASYAMVDNARDLAARLAALPGRAGYRVRYVLFPEETHLTSIPASATRGTSFSFAP